MGCALLCVCVVGSVRVAGVLGGAAWYVWGRAWGAEHEHGCWGGPREGCDGGSSALRGDTAVAGCGTVTNY